MKYIEYINESIRKTLLSHNHVIVFGQNVAAGSHIGGFTKGISVNKTGAVINSTNTENSLVGFGFGIMISGGSAVFFMKQLDFLLLGVDQIVNTYNMIRNQGNIKGSFTIMPIIVDNGFQGPQSSFNDLQDLCSIARIEGFALTNSIDSKKIISEYMIKPGFRIIGISQRLFKEEVITPGGIVYEDELMSLFQYAKGSDATIVSFNLAFPQAWELNKHMNKNGMSADLFNINSSTPLSWNEVIKSIMMTKKLIVLDDGKGQNLASYALLEKLSGIMVLNKKIIIKRSFGENWLNPISDQLEVNYEEIIMELKKK